jgi:hypothetical protein
MSFLTSQETGKIKASGRRSYPQTEAVLVAKKGEDKWKFVVADGFVEVFS